MPIYHITLVRDATIRQRTTIRVDADSYEAAAVEALMDCGDDELKWRRVGLVATQRPRIYQVEKEV